MWRASSALPTYLSLVNLQPSCILHLAFCMQQSPSYSRALSLSFLSPSRSLLLPCLPASLSLSIPFQFSISILTIHLASSFSHFRLLVFFPSICFCVVCCVFFCGSVSHSPVSLRLCLRFDRLIEVFDCSPALPCPLQCPRGQPRALRSSRPALSRLPQPLPGVESPWGEPG